MKPYRVERVSSEIRNVVGEAIVSRLSDPRISRFSSVTRVVVSPDLSFADVYISVMGTVGEQRRTIAGLEHARGRVQGLLARRLSVRQCPAIRFHLDESIKRGTETIRMIDEVMGRQPGEAPDEDNRLRGDEA
jgi:ribosome-binding factor A